MASEKFKPPSDEFMRAVISSGSPTIMCEFCGRVHFATLESYLYEEGELEDLLAKAKENPDKYIEDASSDSIPWGRLDGGQAVWGCPCNKPRKYEDFIVRHRWIIEAFLTARSRKLEEEAKLNKANARKIVDALKREEVVSAGERS